MFRLKYFWKYKIFFQAYLLGPRWPRWEPRARSTSSPFSRSSHSLSELLIYDTSLAGNINSCNEHSVFMFTSIIITAVLITLTARHGGPGVTCHSVRARDSVTCCNVWRVMCPRPRPTPYWRLTTSRPGRRLGPGPALVLQPAARAL